MPVEKLVEESEDWWIAQRELEAETFVESVLVVIEVEQPVGRIVLPEA